jgi:nitroreductase
MTHAVTLDSAAANLALEARYGRAPADAEKALHPVIAGLLAHRSIRSFDPRPLPEGALEAIIAAAQSASTSSNLQQWSVVAIQDPERKRRIAKLSGEQAAILQAPLLLVWLPDLARLANLAADAAAPAEALPYFESFLESVIDVTLAAQNAVVALEALGLGAVFIGSLRNHPEEVARELNLPLRVTPVFGLCVGYASADQTASVKPRLPQSAVLHRETYKPVAAPDLHHFEAATRAFQTRDGRDAHGWTGPSVARIAGAQKMGVRARMREALHALGFELR